ncbi:hypothetical protein GYMLUDRAFT_180748 [Collybiopsis luxurians FD-317 M1]|uniref:NAD(P)-binding protein n=1 Tax=Collybiopsis luxurians FD-317 M1 TaxID=944289 RepID=A0A0D0C274_9AGAR|nr:hypothetical protein GYMLUDRAFT_180748 [Collybiopsis luxurians FD-317 M1]
MFPRASTSWAFFLTLIFSYGYRKLTRKHRRTSVIPPAGERVLILGASSGIGRDIALRYTSRGARVCLVGRRKDRLEAVADECKAVGSTGRAVLAITSDFANVKDMVHARSVLEKEWEGIDTIIVAAGVSALRPILEVAQVTTPESDASEQGIQSAVNAAEAATKGNYIGPMIAAIAFIPMLKRTSKSPSILLVSSLGAVIPAPTRSIYGSTKSASLLLYQALAIEHPSINFSFVLPSTVQGDFRASAVDVPPLSSTSEARNPTYNTSGLKVEYVAQRCIQAVDQAQKILFLPEMMVLGHLLYWLWPSFIEKRAMKKYGFVAR